MTFREEKPNDDRYVERFKSLQDRVIDWIIQQFKKDLREASEPLKEVFKKYRIRYGNNLAEDVCRAIKLKPLGGMSGSEIIDIVGNEDMLDHIVEMGIKKFLSEKEEDTTND